MAAAHAQPQADAGGRSGRADEAQRLNVVSTTASSVTVSWRRSSDRVGVAGYTVYRDGVRIGSTGCDQDPLRRVVAHVRDESSDRRPGLRPRRATARPGQSSSPRRRRAWTSRAPSVPANVVQTAVTSSSITISWAASTDNFGRRRVRGAERRGAGGLDRVDALRAHGASLRGDVHDRRSGARRGRSPLRCGQHPGHDGRLPRYRSPVLALCRSE